MISFIVSHCDRVRDLHLCLLSLKKQEGDNQILVYDNSSLRDSRMAASSICYGLEATYYTSWSNLDTRTTCYHNPPIRDAVGDYLCFPSDDSYYVPHFSRIMMKAMKENNWEFAYCDMVYDPRRSLGMADSKDEYSVMITSPELGKIDKTCFIVSRRAFDLVGGWPMHPLDWRDGALAEALVHAGIRHGHVPGPMVVHN